MQGPRSHTDATPAEARRRGHRTPCLPRARGHQAPETRETRDQRDPTQTMLSRS
ncbi:hypothetical protein EMIHUDRAFT_361329 [Emiliania huxleyi CCMP1516]|uniref:Uncharacterized protein n=2 Tax=Emiliania huxleyi TaxID=2903 RepID=A0A0D3KUE3_EMIH1|nr:hypothetical protein EMIHUDRAFT_361329 [Emiliania huxleyi CCMP1516]EOD39378.1 hypothetical protein EMIHUDRAFT_361329 [Emiliania huxleyi CCMP1516]|eukprot:XP_005791807.1 hypothetical protein EMIHUDRAFT_361329 [Emiliania huxleyi CCMP1516]